MTIREKKLIAALHALAHPDNFRSDPTAQTLRRRDSALARAHNLLQENAQ